MGAKRAGRPRAPRGDREQRREEILRTAMETFATRGYNKASLAEISDRVGLTQAGVLHYFPSKVELLTGVLDLRDASADAGGSGRPRGTAFLRHLVETVRGNTGREGIVRLYTVLSAESVTDGHPAQEYFRSRYDGLREMVAAALDEARETGEVRGDLDSRTVAASIVAVMDGLQVQWLLSPETVDMAAATEHAISRLVGVELGSPEHGNGSGAGRGDDPASGDGSGAAAPSGARARLEYP
ncbi:MULTISPECIES: TetR/AcrR family transcriptional regulator [unclassified Nocardiopsis]|uniref:TetR/AcrR family transcriptional regulator n=1 Tax=unclassified Nocardiopsis TaxID=2649073 RepID=UPI001F5BB5FE|nr:TetR/AcrR family transcriptional regulator [Nocardiopsis sp. TSRI0078]